MQSLGAVDEVTATMSPALLVSATYDSQKKAAVFKFYENYLYDNSLIVGRYYTIEEGKLKEFAYSIPDEVQLALKGLLYDKLTSVGIIDTKEFQSHISEWANLLNQPVPKIRRVSFD